MNESDSDVREIVLSAINMEPEEPDAPALAAEAFVIVFEFVLQGKGIQYAQENLGSHELDIHCLLKVHFSVNVLLLCTVSKISNKPLTCLQNAVNGTASYAVTFTIHIMCKPAPNYIQCQYSVCVSPHIMHRHRNITAMQYKCIHGYFTNMNIFVVLESIRVAVVCQSSENNNGIKDDPPTLLGPNRLWYRVLNLFLV